MMIYRCSYARHQCVSIRKGVAMVTTHFCIKMNHLSYYVQIWWVWCSIGVVVQNVLCFCMGQCVAMVTTYFWKNLSEQTTITIFKQMKRNLAHMMTLRYRYTTCVFCVCWVERCHGNYISLQKPCRVNYFKSCEAIEIKFDVHDDIEV